MDYFYVDKINNININMQQKVSTWLNILEHVKLLCTIPMQFFSPRQRNSWPMLSAKSWDRKAWLRTRVTGQAQTHRTAHHWVVNAVLTDSSQRCR